MGHIGNGTYLNFPDQTYKGRAKDGLSEMAIYGIVFGCVGGIMLVLTILSLIHRHKMRREKKSVLALIRLSRPSMSRDPKAAEAAAYAHAAAEPAAKAPAQYLDIVAEEEEQEEEEEEEDEEMQFKSSEEKLRFVMNRWMNIMKEKQEQRQHAMNAAQHHDDPRDRPTPANRWQKIFMLMQENKITRREPTMEAAISDGGRHPRMATARTQPRTATPGKAPSMETRAKTTQDMGQVAQSVVDGLHVTSL